MNLVFDFCDQINTCRNADEIDTVWQNWVADLGFPTSGTIKLSFSDTTLNLDRINTNYDDADVDLYVGGGMFRVAPSSNPLRETGRLYGDHFSTFSKQTQGKSQLYHEFLNFVEELKMPGEMSVRFALSKTEMLAFHIWSDEPERIFKLRLREIQQAVVLTTSFASVKMRAFRGSLRADPFKRLTDREVDCLLWLARGDRQSDLADRLGVDIKTIEMHVRNARNKLDARTTPQAIATAVTTGQIAM